MSNLKQQRTNSITAIKPYCSAQLKTATGVATGHHGELLQGALEHSPKEIRRFLVTLPYPGINSYANYIPIKNSRLYIEPDWKIKAFKAANLTLDYLEIKGYGGFLNVHSKSSPEQGFGTSTSDIVATIKAIAHAFKRALDPTEIASIAVQAELACDPVMFDEHAIVFCQREGIIMKNLSNPLPPIFVVGFNTSNSRNGVSTLDFPLPKYDQQELLAFKDLLKDLKIAVKTQSVQLLGQIATTSAKINQRFLPKTNFEILLEILAETDACGLQIAHSGNIAGFLFDFNEGNLANRYFKVRAALIKLGINDSWHFNTLGGFTTI